MQKHGKHRESIINVVHMC